MIRDTVYRDCEISMQGVPMLANLIPLEMSDFDLILGMDWLHQHRASVHCFTREVTFKGLQDIVLTGDRRVLPNYMISMMKAMRWVQKGYLAYLAHVIDI